MSLYNDLIEYSMEYGVWSTRIIVLFPRRRQNLVNTYIQHSLFSPVIYSNARRSYSGGGWRLGGHSTWQMFQR